MFLNEDTSTRTTPRSAESWPEQAILAVQLIEALSWSEQAILTTWPVQVYGNATPRSIFLVRAGKTDYPSGMQLIEAFSWSEQAILTSRPRDSSKRALWQCDSSKHFLVRAGNTDFLAHSGLNG